MPSLKEKKKDVRRSPETRTSVLKREKVCVSHDTEKTKGGETSAFGGAALYTEFHIKFSLLSLSPSLFQTISLSASFLYFKYSGDAALYMEFLKDSATGSKKYPRL